MNEPAKRGNPNFVKKGKPSWKPASLNEFRNKEPGYVYRMIRKDPDNISRKAAEGWEIVSDLQSKDATHIEPGRVNDGKPLTTVQEGKDWVLAKMPQEMADERAAYYDNETQRRTMGLTAHIKKGIQKEGSDTHGSITISSRQGTQILE